MLKNLFVSGLAVAGLGACSTMTVEDFSAAGPAFVIEEYFAGNTRAWGLFEDRSGNVRRSFVVDIVGTWDGETLVLDESFVYNDGETEERRWTITKSGPSEYTGTTKAAVGEALGKRAGNAFNWKYDFNLKVGDGTWKVHFDDWMFLQPNGVVLNLATVTRWGFKIGTVFLSFSKTDPDALASQKTAIRPVALELT